MPVLEVCDIMKTKIFEKNIGTGGKIGAKPKFKNENSSKRIQAFKKMKGKEFMKRKITGIEGKHTSRKVQVPDRCKAVKRKAEDNISTVKNMSKSGYWKKLKEEKKVLRVKRKEETYGQDIYQCIVKAKVIWEELRRDNCPKNRKAELCVELFSMIKGQVVEFVTRHDTVRVLEALMAHGTEQHRAALFNEVKPNLLSMVKEKYAKFFVMKLLKYGTKDQRKTVIDSFQGNVAALLKHRIACDVIELAYRDCASSLQQTKMIQEFYGPEFCLFKQDDIHSLQDAFDKYPEKKETIMKNLQHNLQPVLDKGIFTNCIIHSLLKDYLTYCDASERAFIIDTLKEGLLPILHTRDGSQTAMLCVWHSSSKVRKAILKSFKGYYCQIALEEYGYQVLLAILDSVDDTVILNKVMLSELMKSLDQLVNSESGLKVLKYLVAPRSQKFFHPQIINTLKAGDGNEFSKKDQLVRQKEIQEAVSVPLLEFIGSKLNVWAKEAHWTLFIEAAVNSLVGERVTEILENLAALYNEPFIPGDETHVLEIAHTNKMVTNIIKSDKNRFVNGKPVISRILLENAESDLRSWILCNRGCFLFVAMIETDIPDIMAKIKKILSPVTAKLKEKTYVGAGILLKKLSEIPDE